MQKKPLSFFIFYIYVLLITFISLLPHKRRRCHQRPPGAPPRHCGGGHGMAELVAAACRPLLPPSSSLIPLPHRARPTISLLARATPHPARGRGREPRGGLGPPRLGLAPVRGARGAAPSRSGRRGRTGGEQGRRRGTPLLRPLDPRAAADLRPPPPTRARRSPKILTPPRTRARRRALQQTRPAAATPSSSRCYCPKPPRSRAPRAAMAWSSSRRLGLAPGRATPSCSRRRRRTSSAAAPSSSRCCGPEPPRPQAPRTAMDPSPALCATVDPRPPPWPQARAATDPHRRPLLLRRRHEPCTCGCEPLHRRMWPRPQELARRGRPPAAAVTRRRRGQAEAEEIGQEAGALAWSRRVLRSVLPPAAERARDGAQRGRRCRSQAPPPTREQGGCGGSLPGQGGRRVEQGPGSGREKKGGGE
ncbi:hypothetical protein PVAP13_9KG160185 [Panicum virgatum]|uniref:Uncharacterized protein n=1 Tax=Panicum virgatum TaxID=38727 RepID=A0A8T0NG26_PANVG|nr:hypothetical protein PVAP13_9KG160185 [Panicum virgatum]